MPLRSQRGTGHDVNTAETEIANETEADRVICWRASELIRAGYEPGVAVDLAERVHVDLHVAMDLVEHGCPPELAVRILV